MSTITFQPLHYADVELRIPNVEKAREVLGFAAKVDLDEGLEKTIAWYEKQTTGMSPSASARSRSSARPSWRPRSPRSSSRGR